MGTGKSKSQHISKLTLNNAYEYLKKKKGYSSKQYKALKNKYK